MRRCLEVACLVSALSCVGATAAFADQVTADQALAMGKKLCASLISKDAGPIHWMVYPANADSDMEVENGKYWLVDGRYEPKTEAGTSSVIDMLTSVPKDGTAPKPCLAVSN